MIEKSINLKVGFGKESVSGMDGNYVQMANQYSQNSTNVLSAKEETGAETATEIGIALNTLAREQMIRRLLNDILIDLQVCKIEGFNPKEYIERLKNEIDVIYEQLKEQK